MCDAFNGLQGSNAIPTSIAQPTATPVIAARSALQQIEVTTPDTTIQAEVRSFTDPDQPAEGWHRDRGGTALHCREGPGICVIAGSGDGLFGRDDDAYALASDLVEEVAAVGPA